MTPSRLKPHTSLALFVTLAAMLFPRPAAAQPPCVDYSLAHRVWFPAPGSGMAPYNPTLTLPVGPYRYTYQTTGGLPVQNFFLIMTSNMTSWTPYATTFLAAPSNPIGFNMYVPAAQPLCSATNVTLKFQQQMLNTWTTRCQFTLNVVATENGSPQNLTGVEGQGKVYYAGSDYKAHSMTWTGVWNYAPLNVPGGWGSVQIDGRMASFADGSRVFFKGKDNKLYNLVQGTGNAWTLSLVSPTLPNVAGSVAARGSNEVVFNGTDNQLHQLILSGGAWTDNVVPCGCGGVSTAAAVSLPAGSGDIFFSKGPTLGRVYKNSSGGWVVEQISPNNVPWGYGYDEDYRGNMLAAESHAVYYKGRDRAIHRYVNCGGAWKLDAMPISPASETNVVVIAPFLTKFVGEDRVFYKAATGRVYNLYNVNGVWFNYPLDNAMVDAAGDLLAFEGKIFYINHDKRLHGFLWGGSAWSEGPVLPSAPANVKGCINPYY